MNDINMIILALFIVSALIAIIIIIIETVVMPPFREQQELDRQVKLTELQTACKLHSFYELNFKECFKAKISPWSDNE